MANPDLLPLSIDRAALTALRRDIHAHPETAFEEARTSDIVARRLEELGIEVVRGLARTGVVGKICAGTSGRAIGLRADMDALPVTEANTFDHRSRHPGKMHACGHDGHTAMLLGAAEHLARTRAFHGTVYLVFQPAEEGEGGAQSMVEDGLFRRFPMEAIYGMHNWPGLPLGHFAVHPGPVMAGSDGFEITIHGRGGHAAMPHQTADCVAAGAALVQALQTVVSRNVPPLESAVVSVTQFHAGDAYNVVPKTANLCGTARAFKSEIQDLVETSMARICAGIAAAFGVEVEFRYDRGYPPTINSAAHAAICREAASSVVGTDHVHTDLPPTMGAEDFAFMLRSLPGCYVWIGNGPGEGGCMLHSPHYDFNDEVLPIGVAYWARLVERVLPQP